MTWVGKDIIVAAVNDGLTVWPDGKCYMCRESAEPYKTYIIAKKIGSDSIVPIVDGELRAAMIALLLKQRTNARFVSWRVRPYFETTDGLEESLSGEPVTKISLDNISRVLRCRVAFAVEPAAVPYDSNP